MMHVLILLTLPENVRLRYLERLRLEFPELRIDLIDHHSKAEELMRTVDVLVTFGPMLADQVVRDAPRLKWIQALGTGVDGIVDLPSLRPDVLITNMHGVHGDSMSEAVLMFMLALSRELPRSVRSQAKHVWDRFPSRLLKGKTVGILGVGAITEALAPRCKALGMSVVGVSSSPRTIAGVDHMVPRERLLEAVASFDYFVLLTPYSKATHHIVDAKVLGAMKPTSYLLNLARGGVVDEAALLAVLKKGAIAGAALDVFTTEPLPADHPFWDMENVIVTPHLGGLFDGYPDAALPIVEENLRRFLAGNLENMLNRVER